jgi:hypothetical protein
MTFQEWFYSAPHRAKYTNDHSAYLAAQEAWEAAHEACAKVCDDKAKETFSGQCQVWGDYFARVIRARGNT